MDLVGYMSIHCLTKIRILILSSLGAIPSCTDACTNLVPMVNQTSGMAGEMERHQVTFTFIT
jgi:hypothetical protein